MKKKLVLLIGTIFFALVVSTGTYAYTYTTAAATFDVNAVVGDIVTSEPASEQPEWEDILPEGDVDYEILVPNAPGSQTTIPVQYPTSGEHWDKVNTDDGWDTYVSTLNEKKYKRDLYNLTDHTEGEGEISNLLVFFTFAGYTDGGDHLAFAKSAIKTNGKVYEGTESSQTGGEFTTQVYQWAANPKTGEAWTWEEIDNLEAGVSLKGESKIWPAFCTHVYVMVEYALPPELEGEVPPGDLFVITPHTEYSGDLTVNLYITNTGYLNQAYQYLNMKVYLENSLEADKDPNFQILSLENGVVSFNIEGGTAISYTIEIVGGSYNIMSGDPDEWGESWTIIPEFYCEVTQG